MRIPVRSRRGVCQQENQKIHSFCKGEMVNCTMLCIKLRENLTESSERLVELAAITVLFREMQMETWEFLLQREGDTTWLPLESSDVEILEGRYRIVARCGHSKTQMEVRITHHAYEETPPIRRVQTRTTTTTPEGLMVVIPYTRLKPGIWDLCCSPSVMSDSLGVSWQQSIKLRVLSQDAEPAELPQPSLPEEAASATTDPDGDRLELIESVSEIISEVETPTEITLPEQEPFTTDSGWIKWDTLSEAENLTESESVPVRQVSPDSAETAETTETAFPPLELTLNQTAYVAKLGEGLLVSGQAQLPDATEASISAIAEPQIRVSLRDPQTTEILTEIQQAVPSSQLPMLFSAVIYLPFECKTRLILAEIILYSQTTAIARQTFTITTEVDHLLQVIEEDFSETDELEAIAEELPTNPAFYLALPLEPESAPPRPQRVESQPLIPQPTTAELELPAFGDLISESVTSSSPAEPTSTTPAAAETVSTPSVPGELSQPTEEIKPLSPVQQEFKHLDIQSRFWARLNALAHDQDLSQWIKKATPKALPQTPFISSSAQPSTPEDRVATTPESPLDSLSTSMTADLESQEIVIDDEPLEVSPSFFARRDTAPRLTLAPSPNSQADSPQEALPDDEVIPAPILEVLTHQLVAGRSVPVRVRLPQSLPRIYIKIWVYDRQARSIIDGPRWLTEFAPNGLEQIETTVNLDIAYGSLEVQIEAIAVEMQTQRESHKATLECSVIPPAEPSLPLEED